MSKRYRRSVPLGFRYDYRGQSSSEMRSRGKRRGEVTDGSDVPYCDIDPHIHDSVSTGTCNGRGRGVTEVRGSVPFVDHGQGRFRFRRGSS